MPLIGLNNIAPSPSRSHALTIVHEGGDRPDPRKRGTHSHPVQPYEEHRHDTVLSQKLQEHKTTALNSTPKKKPTPGFGGFPLVREGGGGSCSG